MRISPTNPVARAPCPRELPTCSRAGAAVQIRVSALAHPRASGCAQQLSRRRARADPCRPAAAARSDPAAANSTPPHPALPCAPPAPGAPPPAFPLSYPSVRRPRDGVHVLPRPSFSPPGPPTRGRPSSPSAAVVGRRRSGLFPARHSAVAGVGSAQRRPALAPLARRAGLAFPCCRRPPTAGSPQRGVGSLRTSYRGGLSRYRMRCPFSPAPSGFLHTGPRERRRSWPGAASGRPLAAPTQPSPPPSAIYFRVIQLRLCPPGAALLAPFPRSSNTAVRSVSTAHGPRLAQGCHALALRLTCLRPRSSSTREGCPCASRGRRVRCPGRVATPRSVPWDAALRGWTRALVTRVRAIATPSWCAHARARVHSTPLPPLALDTPHAPPPTGLLFCLCPAQGSVKCRDCAFHARPFPLLCHMPGA